eukprot:2296748-Rhodomonas_salina.1
MAMLNLFPPRLFYKRSREKSGRRKPSNQIRYPGTPGNWHSFRYHVQRQFVPVFTRFHSKAGEAMSSHSLFPQLFPTKFPCTRVSGYPCTSSSTRVPGYRVCKEVNPNALTISCSPDRGTTRAGYSPPIQAAERPADCQILQTQPGEERE